VAPVTAGKPHGTTHVVTRGYLMINCKDDRSLRGSGSEGLVRGSGSEGSTRRVSGEVKKWRPAGSGHGFTFLKYNLTIMYHRTNLLAHYSRVIHVVCTGTFVSSVEPMYVICVFSIVVDAYALIGDVPGLAKKIQSFFMQEVISETHNVLKTIDLKARLKESRNREPSYGFVLLLAMAGRLDPSLRVSGEVTYNGHALNEFEPWRTSAYISQNDIHVGEMTVKETLDLLAGCQGVGSHLC
ncbi:ABC transporter G family member 35-like protein, partial [Tanacetum coccineum]